MSRDSSSSARLRMTTLWMSPKKRVENESQRTGHNVIPSENACPALDPAAKPESSFQRDPSLLLGMTEFREARLERPAKILEAIESFLDYIDASGVAEPNGAIVAEGRAWHDCDIRLTKKGSAKFCEVSPSWLIF